MGAEWPGSIRVNLPRGCGMNRSFFAKAAIAATLSFAAVSATATTAAAQIGRINFTSSVRVGDQPGNPANLQLDFLSCAVIVNNCSPTLTGGPTGNLITSETIDGNFDFPPVVGPGEVATQSDLIFVGPAGTLGPSVLTVGAYTFTFTGQGTGNTFGPISLIPVGSGTVATFGIQGYVVGGNLGVVPQYFNGVYSAQFSTLTPAQLTAAIQSGATLPVSVSAEFNVVPEPSTYMLLASGIAGLGLVARRRRNQA